MFGSDTEPQPGLASVQKYFRLRAVLDLPRSKRIGSSKCDLPGLQICGWKLEQSCQDPALQLEKRRRVDGLDERSEREAARRRGGIAIGVRAEAGICAKERGVWNWRSEWHEGRNAA